MDQRTVQMLFSLLRSAICGTKLTEAAQNSFSPEILPELIKISARHDVAHLLALGLKQNGLLTKETAAAEKQILKAVYRYEQLQCEYEKLCAALECAQIPFLPLKGSVIRAYYPEPWMRTSCDIDVLIHKEDLDKAISCLVQNLQYTEGARETHDVSLFSPQKIHVELHFDLVEEGRANSAFDVLKHVWKNVSVHQGCLCRYDMTDAFFYFYHIAHMAKHFENGGCGIRPFIDLWILDHLQDADFAARDKLLSQSKLLTFADAARNLSQIWFGGKEPDELSLQMQEFLLHGGVYGSADNRVAIQQKKRGGRLGYVFSRMFIPYTRLKRYYPVLEKHRWLIPAMQVRRWFMLLKPDVAQMAKHEMAANKTIEKSEAGAMNDFLDRIGL